MKISENSKLKRTNQTGTENFFPEFLKKTKKCKKINEVFLSFLKSTFNSESSEDC